MQQAMRPAAIDQIIAPFEPKPDVEALMQQIQMITLQNKILAQAQAQAQFQAQAQAQALAQVQSLQPCSVGDLQCNTMERVKQEPPDEYLCHVCFSKGHWIKDCPLVCTDNVFFLVE